MSRLVSLGLLSLTGLAAAGCFWAYDNAVRLPVGLRAALDQTNVR